jgi:hypothetical protein
MNMSKTSEFASLGSPVRQIVAARAVDIKKKPITSSWQLGMRIRNPVSAPPPEVDLAASANFGTDTVPYALPRRVKRNVELASYFVGHYNRIRACSRHTLKPTELNLSGEVITLPSKTWNDSGASTTPQ